jgi:8-oxo-dGTP diphosphatase
MKYVLGFLFTPDNHVVLIRKNRPIWQKGFLNGVGGKIEPGEAPKTAMIREFREETGLKIKTWEKVFILDGENNDGERYKVHIFKARTPHTDPKVESKTDEVVGIYPVGWALTNESTMPNLTWMIPLMLDGQNYKPFTMRMW